MSEAKIVELKHGTIQVAKPELKMSHDQIKRQLIEDGKRLGLKPNELRVLSTDPYFVGTEKDYTDAQWAADLWDKMMAKRKKQLHLRGFHYWCMASRVKKPDGNFYTEPDPVKDWGFLLHAAQVARYLGIGKWENLVDLKHPVPSDYDNYFVGSGLSQNGIVDIPKIVKGRIDGLIDDILKQAPRYYESGYQMYHLEVWCEKQSMGFVIEPQCKKYNATYQPLVGQASVEKVNMSAERAIKAAQIGKKVRVFYISDWDRYGWSMVSAVARKLEFFIQNNPDMDVKLTRLALNENQINKFNLPKAPKHGEAVVELDALEAIYPNELGKIIDGALKPYYDFDKPNKASVENILMRQRAKQMLKPLDETLDLLRHAMKDIQNIDLSKAIDPDFVVPEPDYIIDDSDTNWVYDSNRDYFKQIKEYKKYKTERSEEEM